MPNDRHPAGPLGQENDGHADRRAAELADRQEGVVARRQLVALGMSDRMIGDRVRRGRLIRLHRGVYAVGHRRLRREGVWLAAVLAAGRGAALSHRTAAVLHGLRSSTTLVEVTAPVPRRIAGMRMHRAALPPRT
jgi:hypothetical protein